MTKKYKPINCNLYDYIEHFAVLRKPIEIRYLDANGVEAGIFDQIQDTKVVAGEEFMLLKGGKSIRLDAIKQLGGIDFTGNENCAIG